MPTCTVCDKEFNACKATCDADGDGDPDDAACYAECKEDAEVCFKTCENCVTDCEASGAECQAVAEAEHQECLTTCAAAPLERVDGSTCEETCNDMREKQLAECSAILVQCKQGCDVVPTPAPTASPTDAPTNNPNIPDNIDVSACYGVEAVEFKTWWGGGFKFEATLPQKVE